jgi:hypothetical protein
MRKLVPMCLIAAAVISLLLPLIIVPSAKAQGGWTLDYDFSTGDDFGWVNHTDCVVSGTTGTYTGTYWDATDFDCVDTSNHYRGVWISKTFSAATTFTVVNFTYDIDKGNYSLDGNANRSVEFDGTTAGYGTFGTESDGTNNNYGFTGSISATTVDVSVSSDYSDTRIGFVHLKSIHMEGTGTPPDDAVVLDTHWAYPLAASDRARVEDIITPFKSLTPDGVTATNSTIFLSPRLGDNVHAAVAGTVLGVELLRPECFNTNSIEDLDPRGTWPENSCYNLTGDSRNPFPEGHKFLSAVNTYVVTVASDGIGYLLYLVSNPTVQIGQTVSKGCIIGKTAALYMENGDILSHLELSPYGWTIVEAVDGLGAPFDVIPYLTLEPLNLVCGQAQLSGTCKLVSNPEFTNNADGWTLQPDSHGNIPANPPGAGFGLQLLGGQARQSLGLETSTDYAITVNYHQDIADTDTLRLFEVQLGTDDPIAINSIAQMGNAEQTRLIPATSYTANAPNVYDLTIYSTPSSTHLIIDSICVFDPGDDGVPAPAGGCLLRDPELDQGQGSFWTFTPPARMTNTSGDPIGEAILGDAGVMEQDLTLHPKPGGSQGYVIAVTARRYGAPSDGDSVTVKWSYIGSDVDPDQTLGTFTDRTWQTVSNTFSIDATTDGTISIYADGSDSDQQVEIDKVCITTDDGTTPPGYLSSSPLEAICKLCTLETVGDLTNDVPELIQWIWCKIQSLWFCQVKTILYGIWQAVVNVLAFLGILRLWMSGTIFGLVIGLTGTCLCQRNWFNGQFVNMTVALTNMFSGGPRVEIVNGQVGANFFDTLVSLFSNGGNIINSITSTIGTLITSLRDVLLSMIDRIFALLTIVINLAAALLTLIFTLRADGV